VPTCCFPAPNSTRWRQQLSHLHREKFDKKESEPPDYTAKKPRPERHSSVSRGTRRCDFAQCSMWSLLSKADPASFSTAHAALITPTQNVCISTAHPELIPARRGLGVIHILLFSNRQTGACREMCTGAENRIHETASSPGIAAGSGR
jgi:hypothetical protein